MNRKEWQFLERAYRLLVEVGRGQLRAPGEAELAYEICRCAVEVAGYRMAWLGYVDDVPPYNVRAVAQFGFDEGYVEQAAITWATGQRSKGPTGIAVRTGESVVAQNIATDPRFVPWREDALSRGYASSAAIPLLDDGETWAVLNVYAPEPDAFDSAELELLETVASDASHGLLAARGKYELARLQARLTRKERTQALCRTAALHAHDVNNYLTVVLICLDEISLAPNLPREVMDDARAALKRAILLNDHVLNPPVEDDEMVEVDVLLSAQEQEISSVLGKGSRLILDLGAGGTRVCLSRMGFHKMVSNLVSNAGDAMPDGGTLTITTRTQQLRHPLPARWLGGETGEYVSIAFADSGAGMSREVRERLFDPWFSTKVGERRGVGLSSVFNVVVMQSDGLIAVDSEPGQGTTVEVLLPVSTPGTNE